MNDLQWLNVIATAPEQGERHPRMKVGFAYVLDVQTFELEPSSNPGKAGVVYFRGTYTVVESEDPSLPCGATTSVGINLTTFSGGSKTRDMVLSALESFSGQSIQLAGEQLMQAVAFAKQSPCPLAGKSRVFVTVTGSAKTNPKDGQPWPEYSWQPMQPGSTKGLVTKAAAPAPSMFAPPSAPPVQQPWMQPQGAPGFAPPQQPQGAPWAQQQQAPSFAPPQAPAQQPWSPQQPQAAPSFAPPAAQPWAPQGAAPAQQPNWPPGIPFTPGGGR